MSQGIRSMGFARPQAIVILSKISKQSLALQEVDRVTEPNAGKLSHL